MTRSKSNTKDVSLKVADVHIKRLKEAGELLGHTSRSETMRWLALNAITFAKLVPAVKEEQTNSS